MKLLGLSIYGKNKEHVYGNFSAAAKKANTEFSNYINAVVKFENGKLFCRIVDDMHLYITRENNNFYCLAVSADTKKNDVVKFFKTIEKLHTNKDLTKINDLASKAFLLDTRIEDMKHDLKETKAHLHDAIEKVTERGNKLETLLQRTEELDVPISFKMRRESSKKPSFFKQLFSCTAPMDDDSSEALLRKTVNK